MSVIPRPLRWFAAGGLSATTVGLWVLSRPRPTPSVAGPFPDPPSLPPGRLVAVPGHGEHVVRERGTGAGPPVVLLHGWLFPADLYWFRVLEQLDVAERVLTMDHRGHGRGPRPGTPFLLADVADDVAATLRHLDAAPVVLVGHSMGGLLAQLVWQRHPDVVAGLVLCATAASFRGTYVDPLLRHGMGLLHVLLRLTPRHVLVRLLSAQAQGRLPLQITRMITPETPPEVLDHLPWMVDEFSRGSLDDLTEAGRELARFDASGWVSTIDVPTVVLRTTRDRLVVPAAQSALAARIPDARILDLDLDHDGHLSHPEVFASALREALTHIRRALDA